MATKRIAYIAPFVVFMLFTGLVSLCDSLHIAALGGIAVKYWIYPAQTVVCAGVLAWLWPQYGLRAPYRAWIAILIGIAVFMLWIAPQTWLQGMIHATGLGNLIHAEPRLDGFDPNVLAGRPGPYWVSLIIRWLRLVIVVPILEEVFWRGFLLRYLIKEDFEYVPFGQYSRSANLIVAVGFMLEHQYADWPAAIVAGALYNLVAFRTKSLSSCILAHALTNALLGAWIMHTGQWGFW